MILFVLSLQAEESDAPEPDGQPEAPRKVLVGLATLQKMSLLKLAKYAARGVQENQRANAVFSSGLRDIEIDDSFNGKAAKMILLQFGHLAHSISVDGAGKALDIMVVFSEIGSAIQGTSNLKSLELTSFRLDLFKLVFDEQVPVFDLLSKLEEISLNNCDIKNFAQLLLITAKSLKEMRFVECKMDENTAPLFALAYPELQKLTVISKKTCWNSGFVNRIFKGTPKLEELTLSKSILHGYEISDIGKLPELKILEIRVDGSFSLNDSQLTLQRIKIVGSGTTIPHRRLNVCDMPVVKSLSELTFLNSIDSDEPSPYGYYRWRKFNNSNDDNADLDYPNLSKFTLSTTGDLTALFHVVPHMKNLTFFSFMGESFDDPTFNKLMMYSSGLEMINIIAKDLPPLGDVMDSCNMFLKGNTTVIALRTAKDEFVRPHRHPKGIIFYPSPNNEGLFSKFKIRGDGRFDRATRLVDRNRLVRIGDKKVFDTNIE